MADIELTPALLSMRVIARTDEAVYLRLPAELQRDMTCSCDHCKGNLALQKWDTLVVPVKPGTEYRDNHTYTVHMPDASVPVFIEHTSRKRTGGKR